MNQKIDIVMPWVDGGDPVWFKEKQKYNPSISDDDNINRYRDWDILKYWFRSVEKYAPWVNKIHFITYGHLPSWLNTENEKLHIVKHSDYIRKEYLPVFSSHPIELNMHRIEGLSEQFIYFNDDFFLTADTTPEDFFINGKPVDTVTEIPFRFLFGQIDHIIGNNILAVNKHFNKRQVIKKNFKKWFSLKAPKAAFKNLYMLPVNGFSAFWDAHTAQPFLKSTIEEVWKAEGDLLKETSSHKFRSNSDVNQWLFRYWQFCNGNFIQSGKVRGKFLSIGKDDNEIKNSILNKTYKNICLSDDVVDIDFEKEKAFLKEIFETALPQKSSFEK